MVRNLRKGFTLVEVLIVIIIIGILAAALLLSSSSTTDRAEAANFINDLRSFRTAYALVRLEADNPNAVQPHLNSLERYMDNPNSKWFSVGYGFILPHPANGNRYYWMFYMNDYSPGVRRILANKAVSLGYYGGAFGDPFPRPPYSGGGLLFYAAH